MADKVTRYDLEKIRALKKEIESLEATEPTPTLVPIFYKDYKTGKGIPKSDVGFDDGSEQVNELRKKINAKRRQLIEAVTRLEDFLDGIEDPEERSILRWYYVEGLTQEEIARRMNYSRSLIQFRISRFWEKI